MIRVSTALFTGLLLPAAAYAQYIGGHAPAPPAAPAAGTFESPEGALARNVRLLAINPKDYNALLGAGRASLRLGDPQAAIGFFGRAEEVNPAHWAPKAGQASALAQMGEPGSALEMFEQAQRLGATQSMIALDRGLAFDLLARQADAQADYRAVLPGVDEAEAKRRLALSLAISGRKIEALATLDPLLVRRDSGARRARAFILALGGDVEGARKAIAILMPGVGNGFDPFLRRLATLGPGQKAAAVHLGMMPAEGAALAEAEPTPAPATAAPVRVASKTPVRRPARAADKANVPAVITPAKSEPEKVTALGGRSVTVEDRLASLDDLLAKLPSASPPPAPKPVVEKAAAKKKPGTDKVVAGPKEEKPVKLAAKETSAKSKAEADKKTKAVDKDGTAAKRKGEETDKPVKAGGSRIYVQILGGANADRLSKEYERIKAKKPALFKARTPVVNEVKGWSRLLIGPFKDGEAAQDFVNDLHGAKLEGFVWTAPSGTKFEKLAAK